MKFPSKQIILFFILLLPSLVFAEQNIAVIDVQGAVANSNYAKASLNKLQERETFKVNYSEYNTLGKEIQTLQEEGNTNGLTWSDDEKKKHQQVLREKISKFKRVSNKLESEKAAAERKILEDLSPKIDEILGAMIKEKKLDMLINSRAVYFKSPETDLTRELLERLNKAQ